MLKEISPEIFLPTGATGITPNGKEIYISDISHFKLSFQTKKIVSVDVFDSTGTKVIDSHLSAYEFTPSIDNAFYSKSQKKVFIQWDKFVFGYTGKLVFQCELTRENFDLSPLETLPSLSQEQSTAHQKADAANVAHELENTGFLNQVFHSITGFDFDLKNIILVLGLGVTAIVVIKNISKQK